MLLCCCVVLLCDVSVLCIASDGAQCTPLRGLREETERKTRTK